jgi:hypothetical protein
VGAGHEGGVHQGGHRPPEGRGGGQPALLFNNRYLFRLVLALCGTGYCSVHEGSERNSLLQAADSGQRRLIGRERGLSPESARVPSGREIRRDQRRPSDEGFGSRSGRG